MAQPKQTNQNTKKEFTLEGKAIYTSKDSMFPLLNGNLISYPEDLFGKYIHYEIIGGGEYVTLSFYRNDAPNVPAYLKEKQLISKDTFEDYFTALDNLLKTPKDFEQEFNMYSAESKTFFKMLSSMDLFTTYLTGTALTDFERLRPMLEKNKADADREIFLIKRIVSILIKSGNTEFKKLEEKIFPKNTH